MYCFQGTQYFTHQEAHLRLSSCTHKLRAEAKHSYSVLWHEECSLPSVSVCSFSQATLQWNQSNATSDMHSTAQMHRAHLVSELIARWKQENFLWSKALSSQNLGERMAGLLDDCYRSWTGFPQKDQKACKQTEHRACTKLILQTHVVDKAPNS